MVRQHVGLTWQFYAIGGGIYLLLSLPLGRLARVVEARVKSLKFNSAIDTTTVAVEVLVGSIILGVIAGLLVAGISLSNIGNTLANVVAAIALAALLTAVVAIVLGLIIYAVSRLVRLITRRGAGGGSPAHPLGSGDGTSDVGVATAMSSSDL